MPCSAERTRSIRVQAIRLSLLILFYLGLLRMTAMEGVQILKCTGRQTLLDVDMIRDSVGTTRLGGRRSASAVLVLPTLPHSAEMNPFDWNPRTVSACQEMFPVYTVNTISNPEDGYPIKVEV
ncbi:hypothetical protein C8R43DRAFT_132577 [Mycena crocata]|nr:hypothetical protein C8R43DRAFT_132577 [Mycena crocata]